MDSGGLNGTGKQVFGSTIEAVGKGTRASEIGAAGAFDRALGKWENSVGDTNEIACGPVYG